MRSALPGVALLVAVTALSAAAGGLAAPTALRGDATVGATPTSTATPRGIARPHFPDARTPTIPDPNVTPFVLSQDYPAGPPAACTGCDWLTPSPASDSFDYLSRVLQYAYEGNVGHADPDLDWWAEQNAVRGWYHVPWLHWTDRGREWRRGLTREANIYFGGNRCEQTWAAGLYNEFGGSADGPEPEPRDRPQEPDPDPPA